MIYATGEYYWGDVTYKGKTVRGPETLRVRKGDTIVLRSATALTGSGANYQSCLALQDPPELEDTGIHQTPRWYVL